MRILISDHVIATLQSELKAARRREIGGVLVGERLDGDLFRIADLSVQRDGGSSITFERDPVQHRAFLDDFFARTGYDFQRFNYFGEWHSHPNVLAVPSCKDVQSMYDIVCDDAVNAAFAVLMIARRRLIGGLELSATEFRCGCEPMPAHLTPESSHKRKRFREVALRTRTLRRLV